MHTTCMDVESSRSFVDDLYSQDGSKCLDAVVKIRNSIIGSNKQKHLLIEQGILPRLIQFLADSTLQNRELKVEVIVVINSLAQGTDLHVKALINAGVVPYLITSLYAVESPEVVEAGLACLKTIFLSTFAPTELLFADPRLIAHLLLLLPQSVANQIAITCLLTAACKTGEQQSTICSGGAIPALSALLASPLSAVHKPSLQCLAALIHKNTRVANLLASSKYGDKTIPECLVSFITRDRSVEMQLAAARCLTYLHRAGALPADDPKILYKTLPCLVRMCRPENQVSEKVLGAEALAYLIEIDTDMQRTAAISDHLVSNLALYLQSSKLPSASKTCPNEGQTPVCGKITDKQASDLKQASLWAFASLGANDEDIRKRIIETDNVMHHIVAGLTDPYHKVRLASVRCLHSLSRSVQQLRTTFQDHSVWKPLMKLLHTANLDVLAVASSTLCNLLLEFSPSKEPILESGAIDLLCSLTRRDDPALRLNGIWALMNMAFQADQKIKVQILSSLGTDQILQLLSDHEVGVIMKTLGLLRNVLSHKPHIDLIMGQHGKDIMQAVLMTMEREHADAVMEQALCILANVADGNTAKDFVMTNEDILLKLVQYMAHPNVKLQTAATFCVGNLVCKEGSGTLERQSRLRDLGVYRLLQQLLSTSDTALFDKVKYALQQFV